MNPFFSWVGKRRGGSPAADSQPPQLETCETRPSTAHTAAGVHAAKIAAGELEAAVGELRSEIAARHKQLNEAIAELETPPTEQGDADDTLDHLREHVLDPLKVLSQRLTLAYDEVRKKSEHLVRVAQAKLDLLTGLQNEQALSEWVNMMFAFLARYHHCFSLTLVDIDQLQLFNETHGRSQGDAALKYVAELLVANARETDFVFRYRSDQFVVALPETNLEDSYVFAERVRSVMEAKTELTISVGVTLARNDDNLRTILNRVDAAIYACKSEGGNCVYAHNGHAMELVGAARPTAD